MPDFKSPTPGITPAAKPATTVPAVAPALSAVAGLTSLSKPTSVSLLLLFFCALLLQSVPLRAQGIPVLRDFEDLPADTPVFNQYPGVTFLDGDTSNFD